MKSGLRRVLAALAAILIPAGIAYGQAANANLLGTVTDTTNAAIQHATVTITETHTSITKTTTSNESGNFDFESIQPGNYQVTAEQAGFKKAITNNVNVVVNSTVRVNLVLAAGSVTETVTVSTAPPALQTDRADVSVDVAAVQTENLPLGTNRNFQGVFMLVPGATRPHFVHSTFFNAAASLSTEVNGQSRLANNTMIEGVDDNERSGLLNVLVPPNEAIQSVNISTNNYYAEFGRAGGAVTNVTIKSGTNDIHGALYEFNRFSALYAKNYFHPEPMAGSTYNYYGANVGAPIIRNKLFIFGDFLRISDHQGQNVTDTLPTQAYRNGDFSASGSTVVYDPATGNPDGSGRTQIAYQGVANKIDPSRISPIAKNILALIPLPNLPGMTSNYVGKTNSTRDANSFDLKADDNLRDSDHLSYRYSWQKVDQFQSNIFGIYGGPNNGARGTQTAYNTALNYTRTFSPTLISELRVGLNHYRNLAKPLDYGLTTTKDKLGIPGVNLDMFTSGITTIDLADYSGSIVGSGSSYPWDRGETNIDLVNNWTKIKGNHSSKYGVEYRRVRDDLMQGQVYGPRGVIQFREGQTALKGGTNKTGQANSMASFLLDIPNQLGRDVNVKDATWRESQIFAYAQDSWQATKKLTISAGLRWELYVPPTPKHPGDYSNYDPTKNQLIVAGIGNNPMNLGMATRYYNFAPRFGLAYRIDEKTVVRAGYGISYQSWPDNLNNYASNFPLKQNNAYNALSSYTQALQLDQVTPASMATGFAAPYIVTTPSSGIIDINSYNVPSNPVLLNQYRGLQGTTFNVIEKNWKLPYTQSWNAAVQRALYGGFVLDVAYVGNLGIRQPQNYNMNAGFTAGAGASGQPLYALWGKTASVNYDYKQATSTYNSLQVKLDHHFQSGFSSTTTYSWQKGLGYVTSSGSGVGGTSVYINFQRNYATLNNNRKHTFAQSYVYELPFGKGKNLLNSRVDNWIFGGWQTSGVVSVASGNRFSITASSSSLNAPSNTQFANINGPFKVKKGIGTSTTWFDTSNFSQPTTAALGNTGNNGFVGPGLFGWDAAMGKHFPIREGMNVEFRAEAFSVTNHPQFGNPSSNISNGDFGQINGNSGGASNSRQLEFSGKITF
jgi:hypothetical protein